MNKQNERLISADGVLSWINGVLIETDSEHVRYILSSLKERLENRAFDPDPTPLPTLKPGDKVRHKDHGEGGVRSTEGTDVWVFFDKYDYDLLVSIWNLEPIKEVQADVR